MWVCKEREGEREEYICEMHVFSIFEINVCRKKSELGRRKSEYVINGKAKDDALANVVDEDDDYYNDEMNRGTRGALNESGVVCADAVRCEWGMTPAT